MFSKSTNAQTPSSPAKRPETAESVFEPGKTMRIGLLGCSHIADRMMEAIQAHPNVEAVAVAARNPQKVQAFARTWNIPHTYTRMEDLLEGGKVDAIYLALPHALHYPWAMKALEQGIAVLCEKPAAMSTDQMEHIARCAMDHHTLFMEAMKTRFVPAYRKLQDLIACKTIGDLTSMELCLCNDFADLLQNPNHWHNQAATGGSLLDGGCYAINYPLDFLGDSYTIDIQDLIRTSGGADQYVKARMDFTTPWGQIPVILESAMDRNKPKFARLHGSSGTITIPDLHRPTRLEVRTQDTSLAYDCPYEISDMYSELDAFYNTWAANCQENDIMSLMASLQQARLLESLVSATRQTPEKPNSDPDMQSQPETSGKDIEN